MRLSRVRTPRTLLALLVPLMICALAHGAQEVRIATYNLENYLLQKTGSRPVKSEAAKAKVRQTLLRLQADVLALQELGGRPALEELQRTLRTDGLDYPHSEHVTGFDTNISVGLLSKYPIVARRPRTNESFLLQGRRLRTTRGFLDVDIEVTPQYRFTLLAAHLKSQLQSAVADEQAIREQEAQRLREIVDAYLQTAPNLNLVVLGDFNDTPGARSIRALIGRGRTGLVDTRPAEQNGDPVSPNPSKSPSRTITWTHHFAREDAYERIDYILLSEGMAHEWMRDKTFVLAQPGWGLASDHRPVLATFATE